MRQLIGILLVTSILLSCNGCRQQSNHQDQGITQQEMEEQLIALNRDKLHSENKLINAFIEEKEWPMTETDSGLRYWIYAPSDSSKAYNGSNVKINYTVNLMDGTLCYSSDNDGPLSFTVGRANVAPGLHEAVCLMGKSEKARFIFPSHLGWGVTGDNDKIPTDAVLVYDVELVNVW